MLDFNKKYQTREGTPVRLVSDQGNPKFPIIGLIGDRSDPYCWTKSGCILGDGELDAHELDLVEVPETPECYVTFFDDGTFCAYSTSAMAESGAVYYAAKTGARLVGKPIKVTSQAL